MSTFMDEVASASAVVNKTLECRHTKGHRGGRIDSVVICDSRASIASAGVALTPAGSDAGEA